MYSNARLSKPSTPLKAPRSAVDEFEVGTHRPSYTTFSETTLVPRHRQKTKQLFDASMKATLVYPKPEIYQLDPSIVPFSSIRQERSAAATRTASSTGETAAVPYSPKQHSPTQLGQAGTVVELAKHRPIAQHVGATYHQYPIDVVGDTLLRQQALLTINNLPSIIARLKDDLGELAQARNGMAPAKKRTPPKAGSKKDKGDEDSALGVAPEDDEEGVDEETENEIKEIERIGREIERVLLRIGTSQEPLADKDLLALKRLGVMDQGTMAATQGEAKRLATEATSAIKVRVAGLKGTPPKSVALSQKKKK